MTHREPKSNLSELGRNRYSRGVNLSALSAKEAVNTQSEILSVTPDKV